MSAPEFTHCAEMEALLAERASGPLEAPEAAALARHLLGCAPCRTAAGHWETLFSLVALQPPTLKEEAAMRDLPSRTLLAWRLREDRWKRVPVLADSATPGQLDWTDGASWEVDEVEATEPGADDATLDDGLALEGDGAFSLGDSG